MASQTTPDPTQQWLPPQQPQLPQLPQLPQPKSTPLDPPQIYYNQIWRVPPLVVDTQEAADALDPNEWITSPPAPGSKSKEQYPKLFVNVNLEPKIISDADEEKALPSDWVEFNLPDSLCKAAEANNAAKAQADAAKAQAQSQSQGQAPDQTQTQTQTQAPYYPGQTSYYGQSPYPPTRY